MEKLEGYNSRIKRLSELVAQLESGELNLDELSEMEKITRELHERSIILRYNAFKDQVMPEEDEGVEVEVIIEEIEPEEEPEPEVEEEQAIDFSIFDDEEEHEEEPTPMPEIVIESEPEPEEEAIVEEQKIEASPEPEPEVETVVESKKEEEEIPASEGTMTPQSFLDKLKIDTDSVASRFSMGKLDTLIGAFGLNERLRYINDLFDGSSEIFSDAIKALDSQSSLDEARMKAAELATEHEWDPEEEVVVEFMQYLNRRYA